MTSAWFPRVPGRIPAARRLFCFPYAGGGAGIFRGWRTRLPDDVELCPVQYPGRENRLRETPHRSIHTLAAEVVRMLPPLLDLPFAFFGHSMGALVAFEAARELRRRGFPRPFHLVVSGAAAPHLPREGASHLLDDEGLVEEVRRMNGTPEGVFEHPELMRILLPLIRADLAACETYAHHDEAPLECSITALAGAADELVRPERMEEWGAHTRGAFELEVVPGDHFFIDRHPAPLLSTLRHTLTGSLR